MENARQQVRSLLNQYKLQLELNRGFGVDFLPRAAKMHFEARISSPPAVVPPPPASPGGRQPSAAGTWHRPAPETPAAAAHTPPHTPEAPPSDAENWQPVYANPSPEDVNNEFYMEQPPETRRRTPEPALPDVPPPPPIPADDVFAQLRRRVAECQRCGLCKGRSHTVFGEGDPAAELVFVGEGPGADEDRLGRPFVGKAGKLLTKIIHDGMKMHRHKVYICNIVKCRPPDNRVPTLGEMSVCRPYLFEQLRTIKPKVVVAMGATAVQGLLGEKVAITKFRGTFREWEGLKLMPTFHPAYLLRNYTVEVRKMVWDDMLSVMKYLKGE